MQETNLITMQQYAVKHKMSTFGVVKLVNAKKLKTIKKNVEGEEREFIIDETLPNIQPLKSETPTKPNDETKIDYEVEFHKLLAKYIELQDKYTKLIESN
jgi:hypothetical protein